MTPALSYLIQAILMILPGAVFTILPLYVVKYELDAETSFLQKAFCFFHASMMVSFCYLYAKLLTAPLEIANDTGAPLLKSSLISFGLCLIHGLLFYNTLKQKLPKLLTEEALIKVWRYLLPIPLVLTAFFLWASPRNAAVVMTGRVRSTTMLFLALVPPFFWMFFHGAWWITVKLTESARIREENDMLQIEGKRYRELREYMDETRALRHDFRHHMGVIGELLHTGQTDKLEEYLRQYTENSRDNHTVYCLNRSIDAMAAHFMSLALAQDTRIQWSLHLPKALPVSETDYCAVLGNLVENALHAVRKLEPEKREITVTSQMISDMMLGLSVKNPYAGEIRFDKKGLPRSSREGHGIGLSSVRNTVHKYHGTIDISAEDAQFSVGVFLNCTAPPAPQNMLYSTHEDDRHPRTL